MVVSDLHLFRNISYGEQAWLQLQRRLSELDFVILNGDIFEFRWTVKETLEATEIAAIYWLKTQLRDFPELQFHYILGNHDSLDSFHLRLVQLAQSEERLSIFPAWARIGSTLIFHGDLPLFKPEQDIFRRKLKSINMRKGYLWKLSHKILFRPVIRRAATLFFNAPRCSRWLGRAFSMKQYPQLKGISSVFFGHTHSPFHNYRCQNITFHNTGAAVTGSKFRPLELRVPIVKIIGG